ncbi:MAG: hypothetical protein M3530_08775 [Thermoproteota archaeon]|nr:hypothetical protein [Thermoproteota archaeon]
MTEDSDSCSTCKIGYLKPTREIVKEGESTGEFREIGTRRVFRCENCGQRSVRVANHKYTIIAGNVKTEPRKGDI